MPKTKDVRSIMRKQLGKEVADAMLNKVDKMVKGGASSSAIEKAFADDLTAHIEKQVVSAVITNIGPIQPIAVKPIAASVKTAIGPSIRVPTIRPISVEPGPFTKTSPRAFSKK